MFMQMDPATQKAVEKERDLLNGTGSMSASLRGSNSSLNSMLGVVSSMFLFRFVSFRPVFVGIDVLF